MSTDVYRYRAKCQACGHEGVEVRSSREDASETLSWEGFDSVPNDPYLVHRQRVLPFRAACKCGSRDIFRGPLIDD